MSQIVFGPLITPAGAPISSFKRCKSFDSAKNNVAVAVLKTSHRKKCRIVVRQCRCCQSIRRLFE